jgi:hypothetical protein
VDEIMGCYPTDEEMEMLQKKAFENEVKTRAILILNQLSPGSLWCNRSRLQHTCVEARVVREVGEILREGREWKKPEGPPNFQVAHGIPLPEPMHLCVRCNSDRLYGSGMICKDCGKINQRDDGTYPWEERSDAPGE